MAKQLLLDNISPQTITDTAAKSFNGKGALLAWGQAVKQHFTIIDRDLLTPPGSPSDGDMYLMPASGTLTGDWAAFSANSIAVFKDTVWTEIVPEEGYMVDILDEDLTLRFGGSVWRFAYQSFKDGATIADSTAIPTVVHEGRYTLPSDGTTQNGLVGLNDGEWIEIVPGAVDCVIADGIDVSGTAGAIPYDLNSDQDITIRATDKGIYRITREGSALRISGGAAFDGVADGGTVADDPVITAAPNTRYALRDRTFTGVDGLANGQSIQVVAPASGTALLTSSGSPASGQAFVFTNDQTLEIEAADKAVYTLTRVDSAIRISGGALSVGADLSVANYTALKALDTSDYVSVFVAGRESAGDGGGGTFIWLSGDQSAAVTNDPAGGIYVAPDSDDTGASGAWFRHGGHHGKVDIFWFGATCDDTRASSLYGDLPAVQAVYPHALSTGDNFDWLATQAAINSYPGRIISIPSLPGIYRFNRGIKIYDDRTGVEGASPGTPYIYFVHPTDDAFYVGPEDPEAQQYLTRGSIRNLQIASIMASPTNKAIHFKQCSVGRVQDVHVYGFPYGLFVSGGIANVFTDLDIRGDATDTLPSDSTCIRVESSNRGVNGKQHSFSHEFVNCYLGAGGALNSCVSIGMGDGLHFVNGYWKGGTHGIVLAPEDTSYGLRVDFTNIYMDGHSSNTVNNFYIPAFDAADMIISSVTYTGGMIANAPIGNNVCIEEPTNGDIRGITFDGVKFGNCGLEHFDVNNTSKTLNLTVSDCDLADGEGGFKITALRSFICTGNKMKNIGDGTGSAHFELGSTINNAIIKDNIIDRSATGYAPIVSIDDNLDRRGLIYRDNRDNSKSEDARNLKLTVADDAAETIFLNLTAGQAVMVVTNGYQGSLPGAFTARYDGAVTILYGSATGIANTALNGTVGADGDLSISYKSSDGKLYIENRTGASVTFYYQIVM